MTFLNDPEREPTGLNNVTASDG